MWYSPLREGNWTSVFTHLVFIMIFRQALPLLGSCWLWGGTTTAPSQMAAQALPCQEIPSRTRVLHAMEQPSTCARGVTWPHHPHQATNHQQAALAKFMSRLKGIEPQSRFTLELGNHRSSWAQHPMQTQPTPPSASWGLLRYPQQDPASPGSPRGRWC